MLLGVVDVVLAFAALLCGERLTEFALGLVLRCLILLGHLILIRRPALIGFLRRALVCFGARLRGFKGVVPLAQTA